MIAAHYLDAYEANPQAADSAEVRDKAREAFIRAGERAESLAAAGEAQRYLDQAAGLTDDPRARAALLDRAGWLAYHAADLDTAARLLGESVALYETEGETHAAARVSSRLAFAERWQGHFDEALERMERAYEVLAADEPDEDIALLIQRLGGAYIFAGDVERGLEKLELAIEIGEVARLGRSAGARPSWRDRMSPLARGQSQESLAYARQALVIALEHDHEMVGTIYFNLSDREFHRDRYEDALGYLVEALELSRRRGSRLGEWATLAETAYPLYMLGRWDEALAAAAQIPEDRLQDCVTLSLLSSVTEIHMHRGSPDEARRVLSLYPETSSDVQEAELIHRRAGRGPPRRGPARGSARRRSRGTRVRCSARIPPSSPTSRSSRASSTRSKRPSPSADRSRRRNCSRRSKRCHGAPGRRTSTPTSTAFAAGWKGIRPVMRPPLPAFRELGMPFWVAVTQLEHAELLGGGAETERLLAGATEVFERLEATPWLERATGTARRSRRALNRECDWTAGPVRWRSMSRTPFWWRARGSVPTAVRRAAANGTIR